MKSFAGDFRNKKVFLTGHTGFKGAWMCVWLSMMGARVKGYSLKPERGSLYTRLRGDLNVKDVFADILDKNRLRKEIASFKPDYVFHLAAQSLVRESYRIPSETFTTNVIGTANVLDALRYVKGKCVCVIVTTDKVYENIESNYAYKETDRLGGYDPYSASKAAAEIVVESFRLSFFNPAEYKKHGKAIASARAGNVIGGGDYAKDRIVPDIYRALAKSKSIKVRNPGSIRPWQHVLEPLSGYLALASAMKRNPVKYSTSFNFGPVKSDATRVEELVKKAIESWGGGSYEIKKSKGQMHEAGLLMLDIGKAKKLLSWNPKWKSKRAIDVTMKWYKKSLLSKNIYDLCRKDIEVYLR